MEEMAKVVVPQAAEAATAKAGEGRVAGSLAKPAKQPELAQPEEKPLGYGPLLSCWPPNLYGKVTAQVPTATPTADKDAQQMTEGKD